MNKQVFWKSMLVMLMGVVPFMASAQASQAKVIFEDDFLDWTEVPAALSTIPAYDGEILIDPVANCMVGAPSESDQTGKYTAPCIVDYRSRYLALKSGKDNYVKIGPIKNLRSFTFIEANTGNSRGSIVSIIGKDETAETPVLTKAINEYTGNAQGVKHVLDLAGNTTGYTNGNTELNTTEFTFTDAQREEVYIIFRNWQKSDGSDPGKHSYLFYMAMEAETGAAKSTLNVFESDFLNWKEVPNPLPVIPAYTGEILADPVSNALVGSPSESDQTGKYVAPCIVDYRSHYMALKSGKDSYLKIGPIKDLRSFTFVEGNTGNSRGSIVSIIGKGETTETPVLTKAINEYTGNAQGVKHVLNLVDNTTGFTNGNTELNTTEFAFTDAQREEAYIIFRNWQNNGSDPGKHSYFFYMAIAAEVEITAPQVKFNTSVSPADAGTIRQTPNGTEFDEGTEITLTATPEFGYEFSKWTDAEGNELATANPNVFTADKDMEVVAVFTQKNTYSLKISTTGGANDYLVTVAPKGKVIDGVTYFEEGTEISVNAAGNKLVTFTNWDDNNTEAGRVFSISENVELVANYSAIDFIVGWDLHLDEPGGQRAGDYYTESENQGMLSIRKADGTTSTWLKKGINAGAYEGRYAAVNWRPFTADDNFYYEISFSTVNYTNVKVSAAMLFNYNAFSVQKVQYSIDGVEYKDLGVYNLETAKTWYDKEFDLPQEAWGVNKVFVRYMPDYASAVVGTASGNDGTSITDIFVVADKDEPEDLVPPVLLSSLPAHDSNDASSSGSIILTFDERVFAGTGNCTLNGEVLEGTFSGKTVVFKYSGLNYNLQYTFSVPAGAIVDKSGNAFAGCDISFTTMERLQPVARLYDVVVAADGSGDYLSVQEAINAAPERKVTPYLIFIKEGVYKEHVEIPESKPYMYLIGQDVEKVVITDDRLCGGTVAETGKEPLHVSQGATVVVQAANFYAENIAFENSWGIEKNAGPQALALYSNNDRIILNNCKLRSYQDTYLTSTKNVGDRHYLKNCFIEGAVDFIYGAGDVYFDECTINIVRKSGGYIVAPSHKVDTKWGYVFMNNTITAPAPAAETSVWYGRPWQGAPKTVFINTVAEVTIPAAGWYETMGAIPAVFADYNTMDANGNPIDLSNRREDYWYTDKTSGNRIDGKAKKALTDEEAAGYTIKNVLSGDDTWQPIAVTEAVDAPVIAGNGGDISWSAVPYAICYVVSRDGKVIGFTVDTSFTDANTTVGATYTVQAVNEFGGLSQASNAYVNDPVGIAPADDSAQLTIYTRKGELCVAGIAAATQIQVFNMDATLLTAVTADSDINLPLAKGSYILRMVTAEGVKTTVVMVK